MKIIISIISALALLSSISTYAEDHVPLQWANNPSRNPVLDVDDMPTSFTDQNLIWEMRLGRYQFNVPVAYKDYLILGGGQRLLQSKELERLNREQRGGGMMMLEQKTGKVVWELVTPGLGWVGDWFGYGLCSTPVIEGDRGYFMDVAGNLVCIDLNGQANGNDGPFTDELAWMSNVDQIGFKGPVTTDEPLTEMKPSYGDVIWVCDIAGQTSVTMEDAASCTPLLTGDYIWVGTNKSKKTEQRKRWIKKDGNVVNIDEPGAPDLPNIVVVNRHTGKIVAMDNIPIKKIYHGQYTSPALVEVDGKQQVLYGDGYGVLHSYAVPDFSKAEDGEMIILEEVWHFDLVPEAYRANPYPRLEVRFGDKPAVKDDKRAPGEIIAAPVVYDGLVYLAIGRDKNHTVGPGTFWCIDPTGKGDVTDTHGVWHSTDVDISMVCPAIKDGLAYMGDMGGGLHCFDARTGERYWQDDVDDEILYADPVLADGKLYVMTEHELRVYEEGKEKKMICKIPLKGAETRAVTAVDGILFVPTCRMISAYAGPKMQESLKK